MTYAQTLDYLFTRLPMYSRIGAAAYKEDLTNTIALCGFLNNPHQKFKSIHIAGTNGKGSVSHMLAAVLQAAGYKTGLHTSPHLKDFRERIRINGQMVPEEFVIGFTEKIRPAIDTIDPSFFEISVAMAFEYFAQEEVDIAIIETGLGGRLDSTNVVTPELSVITNIGWDHMNLLGNTLEKIAAEKAGIIKPGIPVVIGEVIPETEEVFISTAKKNDAPLSVASQKFSAMDWKWKDHFLQVEVAEQHRTDRQVYQLDLPGLYQTKNLLTVLDACAVLKTKGWHITDEVIHAALRQVKKTTGLHGRWETIHQHPAVVLDVAHNEAGIKQLNAQLELLDYHALHIVIGMVKDKAIDQVLALLPASAHYYFTQASIPRALDAATLQTQALAAGLKGKTYPDVNNALKEALAIAKPNDLVLVCGSVFLVAEVSL
ncbi:MAG: dihydrofolate synthase [Citrobacter freundii]|nr:MAG: dihydrofolate synthase [Citrobacter freundii]